MGCQVPQYKAIQLFIVYTYGYNVQQALGRDKAASHTVDEVC
jgi:hypothetical protein